MPKITGWFNLGTTQNWTATGVVPVTNYIKRMAICGDVIIYLSASLTCKGLAHHQSLELGANYLSWGNTIELWLALESNNAILICLFQDIGKWRRP